MATSSNQEEIPKKDATVENVCFWLSVDKMMANGYFEEARDHEFERIRLLFLSSSFLNGIYFMI